MLYLWIFRKPALNVESIQEVSQNWTETQSIHKGTVLENDVYSIRYVAHGPLSSSLVCFAPNIGHD